MVGTLIIQRVYERPTGDYVVDEVSFTCPSCGEPSVFAFPVEAMPASVVCPVVECGAEMTDLTYGD